jgi:hypothetical protein
MNVSIADLPIQFGNRDGMLDKRCHALNIITFKVPQFQRSFYWDPSVAIDETKAQMSVEDDPAKSYAKREFSPYLGHVLAVFLLFFF